MIEVQLRLQKALLALKQIDPSVFGNEAERISNIALDYAQQALVVEQDKKRINKIANEIRSPKDVFRG
jgi:hypothetical protein